MISTKLKTLFKKLPVVPIMVFSVVQDLNRDLTLPLLVTCPWSAPVWEFCTLFLMSLILTHLRNAASYFVECLQFEFLGCVLRIRLRLCIFWQKQYRNDVVPFSAHHVWRIWIRYIPFLVVAIVITWVQCCLIGFSDDYTFLKPKD